MNVVCPVTSPVFSVTSSNTLGFLKEVVQIDKKNLFKINFNLELEFHLRRNKGDSL